MKNTRLPKWLEWLIMKPNRWFNRQKTSIRFSLFYLIVGIGVLLTNWIIDFYPYLFFTFFSGIVGFIMWRCFYFAILVEFRYFYYDGTISGGWFLDRALTDEEIKALYSDTLDLTEFQVMHYKMNDDI